MWAELTLGDYDVVITMIITKKVGLRAKPTHENSASKQVGKDISSRYVRNWTKYNILRFFIIYDTKWSIRPMVPTKERRMNMACGCKGKTAAKKAPVKKAAAKKPAAKKK